MELGQQLFAALKQIGLVPHLTADLPNIITCKQLTQPGHIAGIAFELPTSQSLPWMRVWVHNAAPFTNNAPEKIETAIALLPGFCLRNNRPTLGTPVVRARERRIDIAHQVPLHDGLPSLELLEEIIDGILYTAVISAHLLDKSFGQPPSLHDGPKTRERFEKDFIQDRFFCHNESDPTNPTPPSAAHYKEWLTDDTLPRRARLFFEGRLIGDGD